jgi:hypothetical protein
LHLVFREGSGLFFPVLRVKRLSTNIELESGFDPGCVKTCTDENLLEFYFALRSQRLLQGASASHKPRRQQGDASKTENFLS